MSETESEKSIHAFISSRVDTCNATNPNTTAGIHTLPSIHPSSASHPSTEVTSLAQFNTELPLKSFFWFIKLCGLANQYISDLLSVNNPARPLRSSGADFLTVPSIRNKCAEGAFSYLEI